MHLFNRFKWEIATGIGITLLFFLTRIPLLTNIPIFTDEAIYLRWAQIALNDANWRFISLTDGKQPLFIWTAMILMMFFEDPLVAGRLVSVLAGLGSVVGLFFLGREVFHNKWIGYLSAFLYVVFPFALVYDRVAVYDSLVGTFFVWGLFLTVLLVRKMRLDLALLLGFVTGAAVLNKSSGFFTLYLFPFTLLLFDWSRKEQVHRFLKLLGLGLIVVVMTYGIYSILRLSPFFYIIEEKNAVFVYPLHEWIKHPFDYLFQNARALLHWFTQYMSAPFLVGAVASFLIKRENFREKLVLFLWFAAPFGALALFGKTLYPRYIFFMTLPLLPLIAYFIYHLYFRLRKSTPAIVGLALLSFLVIGYTNLMILTNFGKAPIPQSDKAQLYTDWPSGAGITESIAFFRERIKEEGEIMIATQGTFGLLPYAYEIYFHDNPQVEVKGYWPIGQEPPQEVLEKSKSKPVYFVFYQECPPCIGKGLAPENWPLEQVFQYQKEADDAYLTVYRLSVQ